ncbi:MAG: DUF3793 family protein [Geobacter sp.]|nr:MAG: DUF3793 family protein [Geobacter sp.]
MAYSLDISTMKRYRKPQWVDIAAGFPDDRDCLAAFIAFEAAGVLEGVKPSSLINLLDRARCCGRNPFAIWKEHGRKIVRKSSLEAMVMAKHSGSLLLLCYDRAELVRLLSNKGLFAMLRKAGYQGNLDVKMLLSEFRTRFASGGIPHEIGIILGCPLKDLAGFVGVGRLRFTCQGSWRIYGGASERKQSDFYPCNENESHYLKGGAPCASH